MTEYTLYYWPIPFRGQLIRSVLAHVGATWTEADAGTVKDQRAAAPADQVIPHMGPPVLTDHATGISLAQTGAILVYLGHKHALIPDDPARAALTTKIAADADDVLYEMTRHNGDQMWTSESWHAFQPRLARWMTMFDVLGRRFGLTPTTGHMLGTDAPGIADLVTATLWGTMTAKLPPLRPLLDAKAPAIAGLCNRIAALSEQKDLKARTDVMFGHDWCSGQIEASLRAVTSAAPMPTTE